MRKHHGHKEHYKVSHKEHHKAHGKHHAEHKEHHAKHAHAHHKKIAAHLHKMEKHHEKMHEHHKKIAEMHDHVIGLLAGGPVKEKAPSSMRSETARNKMVKGRPGGRVSVASLTR
jgi:hypothetical protein